MPPPRRLIALTSLDRRTTLPSLRRSATPSKRVRFTQSAPFASSTCFVPCLVAAIACRAHRDIMGGQDELVASHRKAARKAA